MSGASRRGGRPRQPRAFPAVALGGAALRAFDACRLGLAQRSRQKPPRACPKLSCPRRLRKLAPPGA
eukprot:12907328-Alexandrium_andersonii.AAC.1